MSGIFRMAHPRCFRGGTSGLWLIFGVGAVYRLVLAWTLPPGYDELYDCSVGLLRMRDSWPAFWIEVPVERSTLIAPLWWWLQAIPMLIAGDVSLWAIRVVGVAAGMAALPLGYWLARRHFGPRTAFIFVTLLCTSDVFAFCSSRGEFAEPLLVLLLLPCLFGIGRTRIGVARGLWWAALLLTSIGKGAFLVGILVCVELLSVLTLPTGRVRQVITVGVSLLLAAIPVLAWLILVDRHYAGRSIPHGIGSVENVWALLAQVTIHYTQAKAHVTGTARDAAQVFLDARVWPVTSLTAIPLLGALIYGLRRLPRLPAAMLRRNQPGPLPVCVQDAAVPPTRRDARDAAPAANARLKRDLIMAGLALWSVVAVLLILARGTAGARFHLLYLPAAWLLIAAAVARYRFSKHAALAWPGLASTWAGAAFSWVHWGRAQWSMSQALVASAIGIFVTCTLFLLLRARGSLRRTALIGAWFGLSLAGLAFSGPLWWSPLTANDSEPMYTSVQRESSLTRLDASSGLHQAKPDQEAAGYYVYLANHFLSFNQLDPAEHYARKGVAKEPQSAVAWFYLGWILDERGGDIDTRRAVWLRAYRLKPDSPAIRERLNRLLRIE